MEESITVDNNKEKSIFERAIIEAFKQIKVSVCCEKLTIAFNELPNYVEETKTNKKYLLNSNILDKLNRISERNFININILISKIFINILDENNFLLLSNDAIILIAFSNALINILDSISSCNVYYELTKKIVSFLKFLEKNSAKYLSEEQADTIKNLQQTLLEKIVSNEYKNFKYNYETNIIPFCKKENAQDKNTGISNLYTYFFKFISLNEQFDLLCEYGQNIIRAVISQPNPSLVEVYYKLADFMISFCYNFLYKAIVNEKSEPGNNQQYYLIDLMEENLEIPENLKILKYNGNETNNIKFLDGKFYELNEQKEILLKYTNIFTLCISIINCLITYEKSFKCQIACFMMLKRLYFIFPKYRLELEDLITSSLINLISFKNIENKETKEPYEKFLIYLLQQSDDQLKNKIINVLKTKNNEIETNFIELSEKTEKIPKNEAECEKIYIENFNLRVGCPVNMEIQAGCEEEKLIDVKFPNSLIYIAFNCNEKDINFHLIKYCPDVINNNEDNQINEYEDQPYFYEVFNLEKIQSVKIVLFAKFPCIYKVLFDNKYSWFSSKSLKYRLTVLTELGSDKKKFEIKKSVIEDKKTEEEINKEKEIEELKKEMLGDDDINDIEDNMNIDVNDVKKEGENDDLDDINVNI